MMTIRRSDERHHGRRRKQEVWSTFRPKDQRDPLAGGFGTLEILNEERVPPGVSIARFRPDDIDVVTYVREGALAYEDSIGRSGIIHAGEFRRTSTGCGIRHSEANVSRSDWAHVFQVWFRASDSRLEPSHEQKRFSAAERRGILCMIASPDARKASLLIHQDAVMYSTILQPGQHMVHELSEGRCAWLHLVHGEVTIDDVVLTTGDGMGVSAERAVSVTARGETEVLLFDLGERPLALPVNGHVPGGGLADLQKDGAIHIRMVPGWRKSRDVTSARPARCGEDAGTLDLYPLLARLRPPPDPGSWDLPGQAAAVAMSRETSRAVPPARDSRAMCLKTLRSVPPQVSVL